jgi:hypothetical protein
MVFDLTGAVSDQAEILKIRAQRHTIDHLGPRRSTATATITGSTDLRLAQTEINQSNSFLVTVEATTTGVVDVTSIQAQISRVKEEMIGSEVAMVQSREEQVDFRNWNNHISFILCT